MLSDYTAGLKGPSGQAKITGRGEHVAVVAPHLALARILGGSEVYCIGGSQEKVLWRGEQQRACPSQQAFGDRLAGSIVLKYSGAVRHLRRAVPNLWR